MDALAILNTMDLLTAQVVNARVGGYNFEEIAMQLGVTPEEAVSAWKSYIDSMQKMPPEEQWVLHLLRLENLLVKCNYRLNAMSKAEDFELVLKLLDRLASLQALNLDMKKDAQDKLVQITKAQTALILQAVFSIRDGIEAHITQALEQGDIELIKGELVGESFRQAFNAHAQIALAEGVDE
jgi:hypothetical protein